ncbi:beta-glucosidase BglX [Christiangramia flava]|uniref:beta-glucosidase n=1 Tax=Christiangramia flava JLT2011 TaxID=1229726 RepID=A0A1L7I4Z6_9FLAO|nr:beta-glucosidase BglX [Christiangramia flava]APU68294.1 Periplasmic beta-glucosidase [Christiangramia flava JLT2011]
MSAFVGVTSFAQISEIKSSVDRVEEKVDSVLQKMTLEEKIGQMVQYNGSWDLTGPASDKGNKEKEDRVKKGMVGSMLNVLSVEATEQAQRLNMENSRMKIPMMFGYDVIHGYKTIFPVPLAETSSWDLEAMEESARIAALESAVDGVNWTFSPMIDVSRDARWGRIMEGSGEDPFLTSKVGEAKIRGYQGEDLSDPKTIAATAKHFAGYGFVEGGKDYNSGNIGIRELHNFILPPFKAAAKAGAATFMNSFNTIDGIPATASEYLQRDILKGDWNWDGFVVSDWGSIAELIPHGIAKDKTDAARIAVKAGSDMDMEGGAYESGLKSLVENGTINENILDDAVRRILRVKFKMGLFDDPYRYSDAGLASEFSTEDHLNTARDIARKSIVLLKNEQQLLPLKGDENIAIIGPLADDKDTPIGNWRAQGEKNSAVSVIEGFKNSDFSGSMSFEKGVALGKGERSFLMPLEIEKEDRSGISAAVEIAKNADKVILVLGEDAFQTGEGRSQADVSLAGLQKELMDKVFEVNKNIILVLINGRPIEVNWAAENIPAIVEAWQLGSESGNAIADVLLGKYNPSGKLPVSFPRNSGQEPLYYNHLNTGRPSNPQHVTYSHYTDVEDGPLYPFGFGLSYTSFEYAKPGISSASLTEDGTLTLKVSVTNTGSVKGKEVVQLYVKDLVAKIARPVKELKGFELVELEAGESKEISFEISSEMLQFYDGENWIAEPGEFEAMVGTNSAEVQSIKFELK